MANQPAALIVGVGPGLGSALAAAFAQGGHAVALGARGDGGERCAQELSAQGLRALSLRYDATDPAAVAQAVASAQEALGPIGVLVYNVGNMVRGDVQELAPEDFWAALAAGPFGAFLHTRELLPEMAQRGGGTVILTGATSSVRAPAQAPAFAAAKFGLRGLALSLARRWGPRGVHVAHVLIDGVIRTPRSRGYLAPGDPALEPADVALSYLELAHQPRSAWTFELDLRPAGDDIGEN